jgi:hypothetical protein
MKRKSKRAPMNKAGANGRVTKTAESPSEDAAKIPSWLHYTPRLLAIAFILFVSIVVCKVATGGDVWSRTGHILVSLIPSFALLIVLLLAWRFEIVGAVFFTLFGVAYLIMARNYSPGVSLVIAGPPLVAGILFGVSWWLRGGKIRSQRSS